jgi:hypothetical protein
MKILRKLVETNQQIIYVHEEKTYLNEETFISCIFEDVELSLYF